MKNLDDYLYDIDRRPPNWELRLGIVLMAAVCGAFGVVVTFVVLVFVGVEDPYALMGVSALGAALFVWWFLRSMKRRGARVKAEYVAAGGNPAGTSDLLFAQVIGKTMPDGRWKWPEPSSSSE